MSGALMRGENRLIRIFSIEERGGNFNPYMDIFGREILLDKPRLQPYS
jgi:hypothetical protein